MRVQLDRFEDNDLAVLLPYTAGKRSFDVPRQALPPDAAPGDVFIARFGHDREESERLANENRRFMGELPGRGEG